MRISTCIHKGYRLAICDSEKCDRDIKSCTRSKLVRIISVWEYIQFIDDAIKSHTTVDKIIEKEKPHDDRKKAVQAPEGTYRPDPGSSDQREAGGVKEIWEGSEI